MSFRLFIYYCALCGGGGAFLGWALGRPVHFEQKVLSQGVKGMLLGLSVALALGLVDAGSAAGSYVNDERVHGSRPLRSGDAIRLGKSVLRFSERQKQAD